MKSALACVLLLLVVPFAYSERPSGMMGSICGSVLDENGAPASHVRLAAMIQSPGGHSGGYPWSITDATGHYCFDRLELGKYVISADDEKKGYPRRGPEFYLWDSPDPQVTLTATHSQATLDWQIPFRAGVLRIHVAVNRPEHHTAQITFDLVVLSHPKLGIHSLIMPLEMATKEPTILLLPPREDVSLIATAPGYQRWPNRGEERLNLRSGEIKDVTIPLVTAAP